MLRLFWQKVYSFFQHNDNKYKIICIKICLIYFITGLIWIYFSDIIANYLVSDKNMLNKVSIFKGWGYVIVTSTILYFLIWHVFKRVNITESKLYKTQKKNRAIIDALPDILFIINSKGDFLDCMCNENTRLYLPKSEFIGKNIRDVMPENITEIGMKKIRKVIKEGSLERFEYELEVAGNNQYYLMRMVKSGEDEILAICSNITERKGDEISLKESEYTFRTLFESSADAILIIENSKIIDCNSAAIELLGYTSKESVIDKNIWQFSPDIQPNGQSSKNMVSNLDKGVFSKIKFEWWYLRSDDALLPVEIMLTTIILKGKKVFHALCRDISIRKDLELELEYLSYHDQLTGLHNRRFFEAQLDKLNKEENLPFTIVLADVNGLKLINDSFGHAAGDELLKKVAEVIEKGCRNKDIVARLGGDEFVILMINTDSIETEKIINSINESAKRKNMHHEYIHFFWLGNKKYNGR